jgi:RNA polymerase sigma-70 factor (ECF subfamily)
MDRIPLPDHASGPAWPQLAPPLDWEHLFRQHGHWLRTVIRARCISRDEVDELFQDVALAAVAGIGSLRCADRIAPWLYRIAIHCCLVHRRRAGRQRRRWGELVRRRCDEVEWGRSGPAADPLEWVLVEERKELIREAMRQLPERDAEILMLKYGHGWTCRDLSEHLGIGVPAVEARLHRARQRLRGLLTVQRIDWEF